MYKLDIARTVFDSVCQVEDFDQKVLSYIEKEGISNNICLLSITKNCSYSDNAKMIDVKTMPLVLDYKITEKEIYNEFAICGSFNHTINNKESVFNGWDIYSTIKFNSQVDIVLYNKWNYLNYFNCFVCIFFVYYYVFRK